AATFTVALTSKPAAAVTIALAVNVQAEGKVAPVSLTFTPDNYRAPQTVTVTGVDDHVADGNQPYKVVTGAAASTDAKYNGLTVDDVSVVNVDDDSPGIVVNPTSGLVTSEKGDAASFTIQLQSQPTANVTIALSIDKPAEGTVAPASVTFTAQNWNAPQ